MLTRRRDEATLGLTDTHPSLSAANIYNYLSLVFYNRRSKMDPVWNAVLVGGYDTKKKER